MNQRIVPMWQVDNCLYHHTDKERAERQGEVKEVWVNVPKDYFISTWQLTEIFAGKIFGSEAEAERNVQV